MALTKITRGVIKANENYDTHNINSTGIVTAVSANFTGNVSIGGTLTYQDVTNIDSVGIITARAGVKVPDNQKVFLGTGDDLQVYHDGTDTWIDNDEGDLYIRNTGDDIIIRAADDVLIQTQASEGAIIARGDGQVELYHNNSKKFETTSVGLTIHEDTNKTISFTGGIGEIGNVTGFQALNTAGSALVDFGMRANTLRFATGSAERLRITSAGTLESYSPDDTTPNIKWRSNDTNWYGSLNQSVEGGTITSFLSCGGDWSANGTTYSATKALAAYPTSAIAVHNQYNSTWGSEFVFLTKAGGSTTTDGAVTERLRITSGGIIKCGTSSTLKAEINSAIGGHQFISQCSDNNNGFEIYQQHGSTTTRNTFAVYANTGGGGSQELQFAVRGDGCVTKPKSPAFAARRTGDINISTSGNTDVVFNNELIDNGNNYNTSNGRFTAPIAGTYYFGVNLYAGFSVTAVRVMHSTFNKNGSTWAAVDLFGGVSNAAGTHYHPTGSSGMLIDLNVNDYVTFNLGTLSVTGSGNTFLYGTNGTRFFGYLVG